MKDETCEYCDGELRPKTVCVHYRRRGQLTMIENVPARVCRRCGERYYDAVTVERIDRIGRSRKGTKRKVIVPIRDFRGAVA
jgi:YgiT-type zinc finger domain-containing protein